jgi:threonine/homoserine/homoserine lactone efflux protein
MTLQQLVTAFGLGVAFAAPPGIVTAELIRRGLIGGFWSAMAVNVGSLIGDAVYALLAFGGLAAMVSSPRARLGVGIMSGVVLLVLARSALNAKLPEQVGEVSASERRNAFLSGAALSLTNPFAIVFWIGFGGMAVTTGVQNSVGALSLFLVAFLGGAAIWGAMVAALSGFGQRLVTPRLFRIVSVASAATFLGTGVYTWWRIITDRFH